MSYHLPRISFVRWTFALGTLLRVWAVSLTAGQAGDGEAESDASLVRSAVTTVVMRQSVVLFGVTRYSMTLRCPGMTPHCAWKSTRP